MEVLALRHANEQQLAEYFHKLKETLTPEKYNEKIRQIMHHSIQYEKYHICEYLLRHGADPNTIVTYLNDKCSVLYSAIFLSRCNSNSFVKLLLAHGGDPNIRSSYGCGCLGVAINNVNVELTRTFLEGGSNPNEIFKLGSFENETVMFTICSMLETTYYSQYLFKKCIKIFILLLEHGADLYMKRDDGKKPLDCIQNKSILHQLTDIFHEMYMYPLFCYSCMSFF